MRSALISTSLARHPWRLANSRDDSSSLRACSGSPEAIETRASLLAAVETIVAEEGIQAVTTTRVASDTDVAVGTIYRYFADRDAMLLAAYDATVARLIDTCHAALENLQDGTPVEDAARHLLGVYLEAAEATPAHAGLLATMRLLRPIEVDRSSTGDRVITEGVLKAVPGQPVTIAAATDKPAA